MERISINLVIFSGLKRDEIKSIVLIPNQSKVPGQQKRIGGNKSGFIKAATY